MSTLVFHCVIVKDRFDFTCSVVEYQLHFSRTILHLNRQEYITGKCAVANREAAQTCTKILYRITVILQEPKCYRSQATFVATTFKIFVGASWKHSKCFGHVTTVSRFYSFQTQCTKSNLQRRYMHSILLAVGMCFISSHALLYDSKCVSNIA